MARTESTRDIIVQTDRLAEATAFYEGVLGFSVFQRDATMVGIETGAFRLFLEPAPNLQPVLEFLVDDLQTSKTALIGAGCTVEQDDPSVPRCYIRDPFGLIFNIAQR